MKRKFSTIFSRCQSCDRIFRNPGNSSVRATVCRSCRDEREMALFFDWLDGKL